MDLPLYVFLMPILYMVIRPCILRISCPKRATTKVPKVSEGCYSWSHYGGACDKCKVHWNDCKCLTYPNPETGCETCMKIFSECYCSAAAEPSEIKSNESESKQN